MNIKTDFRFTKSTDSQWAGVYGYRPVESEIFTSKGEMYTVIRVKADSEDIDLEKIAKMMVEELQNNYFETASNKAGLEALENASYRMKHKMETIISKEPVLAEIGMDIEMGLVVIKDSLLYALVIGESKIQLLRNQTFLDISKALIDREEIGLFKSGSMQIEKNDKLILYTHNFFPAEDPNILKIVSELDLGLVKLPETVSSAILIADESLDWKINKINKDEPEQIIQEDILEDKDELQIESEDSTFPDEEEIPRDRQAEYPENKITKTFDVSIYLSNIKEIKNKTVNLLASKLKQKKKNSEIEEETFDTASENLQEIESENRSKYKPNLSFFSNIFFRIKGYFTRNQSTYLELLRNTKVYSKNFVKNANKVFSKNILGKNPERRVIDKSKIKRNRYILAGVVISISLLVINSVSTTAKKNAENKALAEDKAKIESYKVNVANLEKNITTTILSNSNSRQTKVNEAENLRKEIAIFKVNSKNPLEADSLISNLGSIKNKLLLKESVKTLNLSVDLSSSGKKVSFSDLEIAKSALFISDEENGIIYKKDLTSNSGITEHITGLAQPFLLQKNASDEIIFYDNSTTLSSIGKFSSDTANSATRFPALLRSEIGSAREVGLFNNNDALYELNVAQKQIFKREKVGNEYAGGGTLVNSNNPPSWKIDDLLSDAIDIEVPYEIYVLIKNKGIQRYLAGGNNSLPSETLEEQNTYFINTNASDIASLKTATSFTVNDKYLAVGDSIGKRVLLFEIVTSDSEKKPLKFLKQYVYEGNISSIFTDIREIKINPENTDIFILDSNKVIRLKI